MIHDYRKEEDTVQVTFLDFNARTDKESIGKKSETERLESALSLDTNQNRIH